ncbi:MAG: signal peptidase II [Bacteriovoracaceae bacterium]|nr:signal peptidase II [Bacteroidota bacterium]
MQKFEEGINVTVRVLFLTAFIVIADQVSKFVIKGLEVPSLEISIKGMQLGTSIPVLGDFLRITFIENPGMAFGIEVVDGKLFLTLFSIVASAGILLYLYVMRTEKLLFRISLALILGGAIGNLIDRTFYGVIYNESELFHGKVVDFIDIDFINIDLWGFSLTRFWVFNIADASVSIGVLMMLLFHRSFVDQDEALPAVDSTSVSARESSTESNPTT